MSFRWIRHLILLIYVGIGVYIAWGTASWA